MESNLTFYIPLNGFLSLIKPIQIGDVEIKHLTEVDVSALRSSIAKIMIDRSRADGVEVSVDAAHQASMQHFHGVQDGYYAITSFSLDFAKLGKTPPPINDLVANSLERTREALAILYFSSLTFFDAKFLNIGLTVKGEFHNSRSNISLTAISENGNYFYSVDRFIGVTHEFHFSDHFFEHVSNLGFEFLTTMIPQRKNNYQKSLFRAINWYVKGRRSNDNQDKLLNYSISLEIILSTVKDTSITAQVAEGMALLLATEIEDRKYIYKQMKRLKTLDSTRKCNIWFDAV